MNKEITTEVLRKSCLKRRRMCAFYLSNISYCSKFSVFLTIFAAVINLGLIIYFLFSQTTPQMTQAARLPLNEKTRANKFERYYLKHEISEGDTIWKICMKYYGSASSSNCIAPLREANQWLPEKPEELETSRTLFVPLK